MRFILGLMLILGIFGFFVKKIFFTFNDEKFSNFLIKTANLKMKDGNDQSNIEALSLLIQSLEKNPDDLTPIDLMIENFYKTGSKDPEVILFMADNAINQNPLNPLPYYYAALINFKNLGELDEALKLFKKYLEIKPDGYDAYYYIGEIYEKMKDGENALKYYNLYLENDKSNFQIFQRISSAYFLLGDIETAIKYQELAIENIKNNPLLYIDLGLYYVANGDYLKAINKFEQSKKFYSNNSDLASIDINIGKALYMISNYSEAIRILEKSLESEKYLIKTEILSIYKILADSYFKMKNYKKSIELYNFLININEDNPELYEKKSEVLYYIEEYNQALDSIKKAISIEPYNQKYINLEKNYIDKIKSKKYSNDILK